MARGIILMLFVQSDFCLDLTSRELVLEDVSKSITGKFMENCLIIAWSSSILMSIIFLDNLPEEGFFIISKTNRMLLIYICEKLVKNPRPIVKLC